MTGREPAWRLRLLGPFAIEPAARTPRRKTRALLAYLAASPGIHNRQTLAEWFCAETADPARTLRMLLSRVRMQVGGTALNSDGDGVRLATDAGWVDVDAFTAVMEGDLQQQELASLQTAVSLYRGDFLEGLNLPKAPEFELWLLGQRARLRHLYEEGLLVLVARLAAQQELEQAITWTRRLLQSNPLLEAAHAHLIRLYARTGQRAAALAQYEQCVALLQQELAVAPAPELQELYAGVKAGHIGEVALPPAVTAVANPIRPAAADLIGRDAELARLEAAWSDARSGHSHPVLIEAVAGGGKTRLVQALADRLPDAHFLVGPCYESTQSTPYAPWVSLLESFLAQQAAGDLIAGLWPQWRAALARLLPSLAIPHEAATEGNQQHLFNAVTTLILGSGAPLLIVIEDLQWADAASLQLFHFVVQRLAGSAGALVLLLGTARSEEMADNDALNTLLHDLRRGKGLLHLSLPPLAARAIERLIAHVWPELPAGYRAPHLRDRLLHATGGNPLFVTEILRELTGAETLPALLPVPPSLSDLVQRRLQRLPASGRQVIESLAVLDHPGSFALLQQISARRDEETVLALEAGLRWQLLQGGSGAPDYDFAHDLLRTAVLRHMSPVRRRLLHGRTARALQTAGATDAALAFHWGMAGNASREGHYALLAGKAAAAVYAHREAVQYLETAVLRLPEPGPRMDALGEQGNVHIITGDWERAESSFKQGLALANETSDRRRQARFLGAGQIMSRRGRYAEALQRLESALATSEALDDTAGMARYVGTMGIVYFLLDDLEQALICYQEALTLQQELGDEEQSSIWQSNIAGVYNQMGRYEESLTAYQESITIDEARGARRHLAITLGNIGNVYHKMGDYQQAFEHHLRALHLRHEMGDKAGVAVMLEMLAADYHILGEEAAAQRCLAAALHINIALDRADGVATTLGELGRIADHFGETEKAAALLSESAARLRRLGSKEDLSDKLRGLAEVAAVRDDWAKAARYLQEAADLTADAVTAFRIRLLRTRVEAHVRGEATRTSLAALLAADMEAWQEALVLAALLAEGETAVDRGRLAELYRQLHAADPRAEYRRAYAALTGDALTTPPIPPLPDLVLEYLKL